MTKRKLEAENALLRKALFITIRDTREKCPMPHWGKVCVGPEPEQCIQCWMQYRINEASK